ncbi:unnamed protein product [Ranitomeya imitator]|uniref:Transglutaminase-like domain-containing protein n=1 Tax=Ranitomeya imitator TaxID=111125 RepID=A0ABN9MKQ7_9NEOB|nr:unnamed protein product [Ranitomeya imitator]
MRFGYRRKYEEDVLDCCFFLLDHSGLKPAARRDPVILSRKFSALRKSKKKKKKHYILTFRCLSSALCFSALAVSAGQPLCSQSVQESTAPRTDSGSNPMFTLVTGIVGRWRAVCVTALQRPNSDAAAIDIVVGIAAASLSVKVNSQDDNGVLTGNWSGNYAAGCSPTSWTGSTAILQNYYKTKRPVQFGQCWVFSGVVTTIMRCVGIPARSITNFSSAHDTEENLKIDFYMNENGEKMDEFCTDSICALDAAPSKALRAFVHMVILDVFIEHIRNHRVQYIGQ